MPISKENQDDKGLFKKVDDPNCLLPVLESRLPFSCFMVNQLKLLACNAFKSKFNAYIFEEETEHVETSGRDFGSETDHSHGQNTVRKSELSSKLWILFNYNREDWHNCITISPPKTALISSQVKQALEHSNVFDWNDRFLFINLDQSVSNFLINLNIRKFGNVIKIYPCHQFYMKPEDAANIEVPVDPNVTVGPMDPIKGAQFLVDNWDHATTGTKEYVLNTVPYHVSAAIYLASGEIACAAFAMPYGNISCLVTHRDHRRKGYASTVLRYIYRQLGRRGYHVSIETSLTNMPGFKLHTSMNKNIIGRVDYICHNVM